MPDLFANLINIDARIKQSRNICFSDFVNPFLIYINVMAIFSNAVTYYKRGNMPPILEE